jgi:hypothetical protein
MTKEQYQLVLESVNKVVQDTLDLETSLTDDQGNKKFEDEITDILTTLNVIEDWAKEGIDKLNQEVVINSFLSELKLVFEKYEAKLEVLDEESGYGEGYGQGELNGVRFTATTDGVTGSKDILKSVILSGDLV